MYTRMLVPLDGSKTAEKVLPYARFVARRLKLPVELLGVIDVAEVAQHMPPEKSQFVGTALENVARRTAQYLEKTATTFTGTKVKTAVEKGTPAEVILDKAAADKATLIAMATHGHSGLTRWLLGSVAEKVLRGTTNPLLLIRSTEEAGSEGEASLRSVIVTLDGSELAESLLPTVAELAKALRLEAVLLRAYTIPYSALAADGEGAYLVPDDELLAAVRDETVAYLEAKAQTMKNLGIEKVSTIAQYGLAPDEIISIAGKTPDNLIAMCSHGRSGVKRWVLGSVTETVVRHSAHPVLVTRAR